MKSKVRLKFIGSVALILSTAGVLSAVGGQLNFLGTPRPDTAAAKPVENKPEANKPKYSFYGELQKRKTEVEQSRKNTSTKSTPPPSSKENKNSGFRYVVQVGAFSKKVDANKIKSKMEALGYSVRIEKGNRKYLVQTTPINSKEKAFAAQKKLKLQKFPTLVKRLK